MDFRHGLFIMKNAKDFAALLLAAFAFLATSVAKEGLNDGLYKVVSDCPNATKEGVLPWGAIYVSTTASPDTSESRKVATDFGFPSNDFTDTGSPTTIVSRGDQRICKAVVFEEQKKFAMFVCTDRTEKNIECTITLEQM